MRPLILSAALLSTAACMGGVGSNEVADLGMPPPVGAPCPDPTVPVGLELGNTLPNVKLMDCSGAEVSMQELGCSRKAAYFFVYAEW